MKLYTFLMKHIKNIFFTLIITGIFFVSIGCIIGQYLNLHTMQWIKEILQSLTENFGVALISSAVTIYLIKYDVINMIQKDNLNDLGIKNIIKGRDNVFNRDKDSVINNFNSWEDFFKSANPKQIDIIGISMYSFFMPNNIIDLLIQLASKKYKIRIIFADPESNELKFQEEAENKPTVLKNHIRHVVSTIKQSILNNSKKDDIYKYISVYYSRTLPKNFLVKSGNKMIVTPYLLRGPFESPTLILENNSEIGFYKEYNHYIDDVIKYSKQVKLVESDSLPLSKKESYLHEESAPTI
ncbi:hypothetical protein [Tepidibacter hydrothermalis]|uniref:Lipoprotein n=1 Tax=Tepidibacter hydrothermalis TaxID=3036126 RepID=A0ABY8EGA1_9FIRM|nr:hypothetical protein [Tepidibacter hydrothermalis]WFD09778.1 hypothetical protein P4S50_15475 [Tepidibacter hydrothermalis]